MLQHERKPILMAGNQQELIRKLQVLQNQNRILQQTKDSFQNNIRRLVDNINDLDKQLQQKKQQNQELRQKNKQISAVCRKLQLQTERLSEQYSALYNFAGIQHKRGSRDLFIKEMELSNRLNQIQSDGYSKVIDKLKDSIESKNGEIAALISQNSKIKKDLLSTTYQFHQQISSLKEEIASLKAEASSNLLYQQSQHENSSLTAAESGLSTLKIEKLQKELSLCQKQYAVISKELFECKGQLHHYKHEAQWLQAKLQKKDPINRAQIDFQKAKQLIEQNNTLRKEVGLQKLKIATLLQNNPQLMSQIRQFDVSNPLQELQTHITDLKAEIQLKSKDITILKNNLQKAEEQKSQTDEAFFKTKAKSYKVIQKLVGLVKTHVPFINFYGLQTYGLDEEQCKLIDQNSSGLEKEFNRACSELSAKKAQMKKLEAKLKQAQTKIKNKEQRVDLLTKNQKQLHEENEKLLASLQTLTKRANGLQKRVQSYEESENLVQLDYQEEQPYQPRRYQSDIGQFQQRREKIQNLKQLVSELQQDREKTLNIIRSKDHMIAQANAEIALLKSQVTPKVYNFGSLVQLPSVSVYKSNQKGAQSSNYAQLLQQNASNYEELKNVLSNMSKNYENEVRLINEELNKKYSNLELKYSKLLNQYSKFQEQYNKLEQAYEESVKKHDNEGKRVDIGQSQNQNNQQIDGAINVRDDNNSINESTIQTINELLKKYQKQFNRFTLLYESEMEKANQLKHQSYAHMQQQSAEQNFKNQMQRLEAVLIQNQQTIGLLEKELRQKDEQYYSQREHYEANQQISDQRLISLEMRCNQLNAQIQNLQRKTLESSSEKQEPNIQETSVLVSVLSSKNNEIQSLKEKLEQKQSIIEQTRREISDLLEKRGDQHSTLQFQEFKAFKNYIQENDLMNLLEKVYQKIDGSSPGSH